MITTENVQPGDASKKEIDHGSSGSVLAADGQPWSPSSRGERAEAAAPAAEKGKTSVLPFAIGGAIGLVALAAAGALLVTRQRARERGLKHRVARLIASPAFRSMASGLGGIALAGGSAVAKQAITKYIASRGASAD